MINVMLPAVVAVLLLLSLLNTALAIPNGYVLNVKHTCGSNLKAESVVTITTDLTVEVIVECKDRSMVVPSWDRVIYLIKAHYKGDVHKQCLFKSRRRSGIWLLLVNIKWSEPRETLKTKKEQYLITCILDPHAMNQTTQHQTKDGLLGPLEIQQRMGVPSTSSYILQVTNVNGRPIMSHVAIGRKIQLLTTMKAANNELGFRAVSCDANGGRTSYSVLRGGCGDGIVFPRTEGFVTKGLEVRSPFFGAFKLRNEPYVTFKCNFTSCKKNCDGDSCRYERRRRDTRRHEENPVEIGLSSDRLNIFEPEARESGLDMAQRVQELVDMGLAVVPESCKMTSQGMVCRAADDYSNLNIEDRDVSYGVLAVGLLLLQACVTLGLVGGLVVASRRDRPIEKSGSRASSILACKGK
uniref:Vitelline envelope zona pellucida domain protein 13 n=1 Tax=Haliotis rufescens TaxID=6454 RepID=D0EL51_HALRU|nr:vitelline envelope zona pellucida domain protein 13 [Haliotis rufescens]